MNFSGTSAHPTRSINRAAAAVLAVLAVALLAPLASGAGSAQALTLGTTFSNQVRVTAPCYLGGVTLIGMGPGDSVEGTIEMGSGQSGATWIPGVGTTWTSGPKTPFRYTTTASNALLACVGTPGTTMVVTYTVRRAPVWYGVIAPVRSATLAQ
jgi:hypothetical protein